MMGIQSTYYYIKSNQKWRDVCFQNIFYKNHQQNLQKMGLILENKGFKNQKMSGIKVVLLDCVNFFQRRKFQKVQLIKILQSDQW